MIFMNEYAIDDAVRRYQDHPVLGPATRTLSSLRDAANANSDGWVYWPKPCRAARKLQELIQQGEEWDRGRYQLPRTEEPTAAQLRAALAPIKAFRTRQSFTFDIFEYQKETPS